MIMVTGGAGFIGANFVHGWLQAPGLALINLDKLTYAGNFQNLESVARNPRHYFIQGDISNAALIADLLCCYRPHALIHFAAESHVDRSIAGPQDFITTNVGGTGVLLEAARAYWEGLPLSQKEVFRFLHVSTDEVYGSLARHAAPFVETSPYLPNSPYAASKAASDHLVRAYHRTYGLPTLTTHCSNNYGPYQFPEKLIPLMVLNALQEKPLPLYGDGANVRDWVHVEDHCAALRTVLACGRPGETYNIGGECERTNYDIVLSLCAILDDIHPTGAPHARLITFVKDRLGHDRRYAIDTSKIRSELGWRPSIRFEDGLRSTVEWYHKRWGS